jgi:hypothetical protein
VTVVVIASPFGLSEALTRYQVDASSKIEGTVHNTTSWFGLAAYPEQYQDKNYWFDYRNSREPFCVYLLLGLKLSMIRRHKTAPPAAKPRL